MDGITKIFNKTNTMEVEKLTLEEAIMKVAEIENAKHDNELPHGLEDALHLHFIQCVAANFYENKEAVEIAKIVSSTSSIDFSRWYA